MEKETERKIEKEIDRVRQEEQKKCQEQIDKIKTDCQEQIDNIKTEYDKFRDDLYTKTIEDKNKLLDKTLVQIASRPTTSNINNTNNTIITEDLGLTKKKIGKIMEEEFTEERLLEGVEGVANTVFSSLLTSDGKSKYNVKDSSRNIFEFKKDGEIRRDEGGNYLAAMVYDGGFKKMSKVYLAIVDSVNVDEYDEAIEDKANCAVDKFKEIRHMKSSPKKFVNCIKKKMLAVK